MKRGKENQMLNAITLDILTYLREFKLKEIDKKKIFFSHFFLKKKKINQSIIIKYKYIYR